MATPGLSSAGSVAVTQGLSCSAAGGIFPDQGENHCLLQGSLKVFLRYGMYVVF